MLIRQGAEVNAVRLSLPLPQPPPCSLLSSPILGPFSSLSLPRFGQTNVHGITPLHDACNSDCTYHVQALVRKGANVNATNKYLSSPCSLLPAPCSDRSCLHSRFGETPLHMAVKAGAFDTIGYLMYHVSKTFVWLCFAPFDVLRRRERTHTQNRFEETALKSPSFIHPPKQKACRLF